MNACSKFSFAFLLSTPVYNSPRSATKTELEIALMMAAFYGKARWISYLINLGVNVNVYLDRSGGFHSHATALHQAVFSASLESVKILVDAGADLNAKDKVYDGTPLGWAIYMQSEEADEVKRKKYKEIENYLQSSRPTLR